MDEKENKDNVTTDVTNPNVGTQANENKDEEKGEKTYTQAEYNALDKRLKEKYEKKYAGIDIAKYKAWEESQKSDAEKAAEKEKENQKKLEDGENAIKENKVFKAGVDKDQAEFVAFKVSKMDGDFDENLAKFLKENPKYLQNNITEPQIVKKVSTNVNLSGKTNANDGQTNDYMNNLIRSARG